MNPLVGKSVAEKIVWLFETRVSEAHRSAIEQLLKLSADQFDAAIARARDLGRESGLRITPMYDEGCEGWWTAYPTRRLAGLAVVEGCRRNVGEQERNARVYRGFGPIGDLAESVASGYRGTRAGAIGQLPEATAASDWVVKRVTAAVEAGKGYVPLEAAMELAA